MKPINPSLRSWLLALSAGTILASTLSVYAVPYDFTRTTDGAWHTGTNWQGGVTPTFNNEADLKFGVNFAMAANSSWLSTVNRTVRSLEFGNIAAALTINLGTAPLAAVADQLTLNGSTLRTFAGDAVKYSFPAGTKTFARLKVTGP